MHYFLDRIISDKDVVRLIKKWRHDPVSFLKEDADNNRESFKVLTENLEIGIEVLFKEVTEANKEHRYPEILEAREQFRKNSQKYSFDYIQRMLTRQSEKEIKNKQKADDNLKRQKSILSQRQALDRSISTFIKENSKKFETISPAEFAKEISEHFQSTYEKIISLETSLAPIAA
jgi:exonuclease VII large subunit